MNDSRKKPVIIISGATASGKTKTSIDLALRIEQDLKLTAQIVNFDSLLFYRELNIGTAKPTAQEQKNIVHHLINISSIDSPLNASDYVLMAKHKIEELHAKNITPILVGGSAFYLRALIKGMYADDQENVDSEQKKKIAEEAKEILKNNGIQPIRDYLFQNDLDSFNHLHENDHYRNVRAYEFHRLTNRKISQERKKADIAMPYDFSEHIHPQWNIYHYYLNIPKLEHWDIIAKRTDAMLNEGLIDEVNDILKEGFSLEQKPLRSIGYKEAIEHCLGRISLDQCKEQIIIATRQLAKAQRTFFNKVTPKETFNPLEQQNRLLKSVLDNLSEGKI